MQSRNPGGLQVRLAVLLSMLGRDLKGDQRADLRPLRGKTLFLPLHLALSTCPVFFSLHTFTKRRTFPCRAYENKEWKYLHINTSEQINIRTTEMFCADRSAPSVLLHETDVVPTG